MEGLCEGVAQSDHASLPSGAPLHHHPGHLHQLDGALPVLQRLDQVQHLGTGTSVSSLKTLAIKPEYGPTLTDPSSQTSKDISRF